MKVQIIKGHNTFEVNSLYNQKVLKIIKTIKKRYYRRKWRGVSRVVKARFNRLTRVSNVEPFAYEDE